MQKKKGDHYLLRTIHNSFLILILPLSLLINFNFFFLLFITTMHISSFHLLLLFYISQQIVVFRLCL